MWWNIRKIIQLMFHEHKLEIYWTSMGIELGVDRKLHDLLIDNWNHVNLCYDSIWYIISECIFVNIIWMMQENKY